MSDAYKYDERVLKNTHTHTHMYIYINIKGGVIAYNLSHLIRKLIFS